MSVNMNRLDLVAIHFKKSIVARIIILPNKNSTIFLLRNMIIALLITGSYKDLNIMPISDFSENTVEVGLCVSHFSAWHTLCR
jgi:hypothetical protein